MRSKLILAVLLVALVASGAVAKEWQKPTLTNPVPMMTAEASRSYFEGFEAGIPANWTLVSTATETWGLYTDSSVPEGDLFIACDWTAAENQDESISFDYTIDVAGLEYVLSFYTFGSVGTAYDLNSTETVEVNGTVVWDMDTYGLAAHYVWEQIFIDLSAYDGQTVTITFHYVGNDGYAYAVDAVMIDDGTGYIAPEPEPFVNDTCEGALDMQELFDDIVGAWYAPNCDNAFNYYTNAYSSGCAPYGAPGDDQVFSIYLTAGETFTCTVVDYYDPDNSEVDYVIYVVTDCADIAGTCIAAADDAYMPPNAETLTFDAPADGVYYFILDTYSGCSDYTAMFVDNPVATEDASFGSVKAMYR